MPKLVKRGVGGALNLGKKAGKKAVGKTKSKSEENGETVSGSSSPTTSKKSNHSSDSSDSSSDEDEDYAPKEGEIPAFDVVVEGHMKKIRRFANPEFREILNELVTELKPVFGKAYQFYNSDPDLSGKWRYMPLSLFVLFHDLTKPRRINFVKRIVDEGNGTDANKDEISRLAKHIMIAKGVYHISWEAKNKEDIVKYFQEEKEKFIDEGNPIMAEMSVVPESPDDIILYHLETQTNIPSKGHDKTRFIIFLDHTNKNLVICFRGTSNAMDALVDLDAKGSPFPSGEGFQQGFLNHGTIKGAKWFFDNALPFINAGLQKHPGYGIMVTGHSLGAMMSITVTMELVAGIYGVCEKVSEDCINNCDNTHLLPGIQVLCAAFAPAPLFRRDSEFAGSKHLDEEMKEKGIIEIAVHKHDIVPRFSVENLKIFVRVLNIINKHVSSKKKLAHYLKRRLKDHKSVTDFPDVLTVSTEELLEKLDQAVLEFDQDDNPRVHPGQVFLVSPYRQPTSLLGPLGVIEGEEGKKEKKKKKKEKEKDNEEEKVKEPKKEKYRIYKLTDGKVISNNMELVSKENVQNHKAPGYQSGIAQNVKRLSKKKNS